MKTFVDEKHSVKWHPWVYKIQRDRATQHFNIPNNVRETGRLFKEYHIKRVGMSAEGYAYIFPVLPIQEEQGALMICISAGWTLIRLGRRFHLWLGRGPATAFIQLRLGPVALGFGAHIGSSITD
ncbi:hypothetical protein NQZ68_032070 [Dissostichus eleginoides]|nr:hypothetical protein NQZ68_032070 [Dissostichus eleginoides]